MSIKRPCIFVVAVVALCSAHLAAQQSPSSTPDQKSAQPTISVTGCVQSESAVLKRNPVAGDLGLSNEFVLTFATLSPAPGAGDVPKPDVEPPRPEPAGTAGAAAPFGRVYRVTGDKETELKSFVGQRVAITGTFKDKTKLSDELGAIGTSGRPGELTPANTPEITIDTITSVTGSCTAPIK